MRSDKEQEVGPGFWAARLRPADVLLDLRVVQTEIQETRTELQEVQTELRETRTEL